MIEIMLFPLKA